MSRARSTYECFLVLLCDLLILGANLAERIVIPRKKRGRQ